MNQVADEQIKVSTSVTELKILIFCYLKNFSLLCQNQAPVFSTEINWKGLLFHILPISNMEKHTCASWDVSWPYMCPHLCKTEAVTLNVSSKHQTKVSKVAKGGLRPCNFDEIRLHDPTLSSSSAQGDFVDDTHSARMEHWVHVALCRSAESFFGLFFSPSAPFKRVHWGNGCIVSKSRPDMGLLCQPMHQPQACLCMWVCERVCVWACVCVRESLLYLWGLPALWGPNSWTLQV